jgi:hypothetical protein
MQTLLAKKPAIDGAVVIWVNTLMDRFRTVTLMEKTTTTTTTMTTMVEGRNIELILATGDSSLLAEMALEC